MAILSAILFQLELQVHGQEPIFEKISMELHVHLKMQNSHLVANVRKDTFFLYFFFQVSDKERETK